MPVQQFQEFYDTYDVKEGDNMYLAPEDRWLFGKELKKYEVE